MKTATPRPKRLRMRTRSPPPTLPALPAEILCHISTYLPLTTIRALLLSNPRAFYQLHGNTTNSSSFSPWRRRHHAYNRAFTRVLRETQDRPRAGTGPPIFVPSRIQLRTYTPLEQELEELTWKLLHDLGLVGQDGEAVPSPVSMPEMTMYMALHALDHLSGPLRLPALRCSLEAILRVLGRRYPHLEVVQMITPVAILPKTSSPPGEVMEAVAAYKVFTAYLMYTSLTPEDILGVLADAVVADGRHMYVAEAVRGEQEMALVEYFHFLRLFLAMYEYDKTLLGGMSQELPGCQARRILAGRLDEWIRGYFRPERPLMVGGVARPRLTKEQEMIVATDVLPGELMKVRAFAGTGKTMSLAEYARARPHLKFLYVAFNKSAQVDATERFPGNVVSKTIHSIAAGALRIFAPKIKDALPDPGKTIRDRRSWDGRIPTMEMTGFSAREVATMLGIDKNMITSALETPSEHLPPGKKRFPTVNSVATVVKKTLEKYWSMRDLELSRMCVPRAMAEKLGLSQDVMLRWAEKLWEGMVNAKVRYIPHDAYLKLLYLDGVQEEEEWMQEEEEGMGVDEAGETGRVLVRGEADTYIFGKYDVIMFDEAQDSNPSMATVILRQRPWTGVIVVGDPYQKIYGFRGATNECFDDEAYMPTHSFYLTHSFRFGDKIAGIANVLLRALREPVGVNGVRREDKVMITSGGGEIEMLKPGRIEDGGSGKYTVIFRKNITLVRYAILYCMARRQLGHKVALRTAGNYTKSTLFSLLEAAHALYNGTRAKTGILADYKTWEELKDHVQAESSEDGSGSTDSPGLSLVVGLEELIEEKDFIRNIKTCKNMVLDKGDEADADVTFTTTHQAKGQEWDRVILANDFSPPYLSRGELAISKYWREEMFMMYVAVTRARKELIVGKGIAAWWASEMGRNRFYISPEQGERKCPVCRDEPNTGLEDGKVAPAGMGPVVLGYECLLPTGSFGAKGAEPHTRSGRLLGVKKDAVCCYFCMMRLHDVDGYVDRELGVWLGANANTVTQSTPTGASIESLSPRNAFLAVYPRALRSESARVNEWVSRLGAFSVVADSRERGERVHFSSRSNSWEDELLKIRTELTKEYCGAIGDS